MQISQISPKVKTHLTALLVYNKNSLLLFFPSSESDALKTQCITLLMKIPGLILGKVRKWNIQRFVSQRQHIHHTSPMHRGFFTLDNNGSSPSIFTHTIYLIYGALLHSIPVRYRYYRKKLFYSAKAAR